MNALSSAPCSMRPLRRPRKSTESLPMCGWRYVDAMSEPSAMLSGSEGTRNRTSPSSRIGLITITLPPRRRSFISSVISRG